MEPEEGNVVEIEDMLIEILERYPGRWPADIINQVFLAIEQDPRKLKRYREFADGDEGTVNAMIGRYVKDYTGKKSGPVSEQNISHLIKSYTILE
jgi:hypothetical protein